MTQLISAFKLFLFGSVRRSSQSTPFTGILATLILIVGSSPQLFAQTFSSGLRGTVTDASGAAIAGATATLTDEATHQVRTATTDSIGAYAFNELRPSTYTLHIEAASFSATDRTHIQLTAGLPHPRYRSDRGRGAKCG